MENNNSKKKSVGLIIFTEIPGLGLVAVLRERGHFNFETMKSESWPGVCQVIVHGSLEKNETIKEALQREIKEELGKDFSLAFNKIKKKVKKIAHFYVEDKEIFTFAVKIPFSLLNKIRLHPETRAIRFLKYKQLKNVKEAKDCYRTKGVVYSRQIIMFSEEKKAIFKAFKLFNVSSL